MGIPSFPGSRYRKIDFHVHTPQSHDYKDKTATVGDIVAAALSVGLDAIAVTDHNDFRYIDQVIQAAVGTSLIVFPGVEISTRDGHLLAIFDPQKTGNDVRTCLISCELRDESLYGEQDTASPLTIEKAAEVVEACGGIAIAAHVDAPKGFLKEIASGTSKKAIQANEAIRALEITDASRKNEWVEGKIYPAKRACIQGSDSHSLDTIGLRPTWIRVAQLGIDGIRQALKDPTSRIRFPDEYDPSKTHSYIENVQISQGFFGVQDIALNPGLNCIVGGQGVGKSALIEFIRFALDNVSRVEANRADHDGKIHSLLGINGSVSVVYRRADGARYKITRTYDGTSNPIYVERVTEDGTLIEHSLTELQRYFPVLAYSQNEAVHVARSPLGQLDLIDSHLDNSGEQIRIEDLTRNLRDNTQSLLQIDARKEDLEEKERQRITLEKEITHDETTLKQTQEAQNVAAIRDRQAWLAEESYLKQLRDAREKIRQEILQSLEAVDIGCLEIEIPNTQLGHTTELQSVLEISRRALTLLDNLKLKINAEFDDLKNTAQAAAPNWIKGFQRHGQEYAAITQTVRNVQIATLQRQLQSKNVRLTNLKNEIRELHIRQEKRKELQIQRKVLLDQIEAERDRISTRRDKQAKRMSEILEKRVLVSIRKNGNRDNYRVFLSNNLDGRSVKPLNIDKIVETYSPRELVGVLREADPVNRLQGDGTSNTAASSVLMTFKNNPGLLYQLEELLTEDLPDIRMRVSDGTVRTLDQLSGGQKFTVIVLLALTDDDQPIVYDQPEDALDTALIYSNIAQQLRKSKDNRQFVFATHNPNMSVAADLDLAIVISGTATEAGVRASGGFEDIAVRQSLIEYLEGGTDAIEHRVMKYDLHL